MARHTTDPKDVKSLAAIREEFDQQGEAIQKDDILGLSLVVQKLKPWKSKNKKDCVRVIAVVEETGQLVHFNGGEPMWKGVADFADHVPFRASVSRYGEDDSAFYLLE